MQWSNNNYCTVTPDTTSATCSTEFAVRTVQFLTSIIRYLSHLGLFQTTIRYCKKYLRWDLFDVYWTLMNLVLNAFSGYVTEICLLYFRVFYSASIYSTLTFVYMFNTQQICWKMLVMTKFLKLEHPLLKIRLTFSGRVAELYLS